MGNGIIYSNKNESRSVMILTIHACLKVKLLALEPVRAAHGFAAGASTKEILSNMST